MNKRFIKEYIDNKIIFTDLRCNKIVTIKHYDDPNSFDVLRIGEDLNKDFVNYIVSELQRTNDIAMCIALYYDNDIENILHNNGFKVSNHNYLISYKKYDLYRDLTRDDNLNDESKKYYLDMINKLIKQNSKYYNQKAKHLNNKITWNNQFQCLVYKINKKIVGIVDFQNFGYENHNDDVLFDYNNKIAIRSLFADTIEIGVKILKDLLNMYKKDIIISHLYTDNNLKEIIKKVNGKFIYTIYTNIKFIM